MERWRAAAGGRQGVEVIDSPARLAPLRAAIADLPLFEAERAVLVRDPPQLTGSPRRGADGAEALARLLELRAPTTALCLVAHARVAPSNPVLAAVVRLGGAVSIQVAPRGRELAAWVQQAGRDRGLRLSAQLVELIVRSAGPSLGAISTELDKLEALGSGGSLSPSDARALIAGDERAQIWEVVDGLVGANPGAAAVSMEALIREGRSVQYLLVALAGQLHELILARALLARGMRPQSLAAELGLPSWRADRLARQARSIPPALLRTWLSSLRELDAGIKAGEVGDVDGLRSLVLGAAVAMQEARAAPQSR